MPGRAGPWWARQLQGPPTQSPRDTPALGHCREVVPPISRMCTLGHMYITRGAWVGAPCSPGSLHGGLCLSGPCSCQQRDCLPLVPRVWAIAALVPVLQADLLPPFREVSACCTHCLALTRPHWWVGGGEGAGMGPLHMGACVSTWTGDPPLVCALLAAVCRLLRLLRRAACQWQ